MVTVSAGRRVSLNRALWILGPGLMVMLADTDAGSIMTAARSGASWGYRLLPLELILIPVLYLVMELTVRIGATTGKGHAEAIRERFGPRWAALSVGALFLSVTGALITEFAGVAAVGGFVGLAPAVTVPLAAAFLFAVVFSGGYRRVELIGLGLGSFELAFVAAALLAHPRMGSVAASLWSHQPLGDRSYLTLVAANVGAVVMPWMIFYQQGAVVDKGLRAGQIRIARLDTALGAVLTQVVMAAILVATATTLSGHGGASLTSVGQISAALSPYIGAFASRLALALGIGGAALLASLVVSLAASWAVAESFGAPRSLNHAPRTAPQFYGIYATCVTVGAAVVLASHSLVSVAIDVEILNMLLLPVVIGFLVAVAWTTLPREHRLRIGERVAVAAVAAAVVAIGLAWTALTILPSSGTPTGRVGLRIGQSEATNPTRAAGHHQAPAVRERLPPPRTGLARVTAGKAASSEHRRVVLVKGTYAADM